MEGINNPYSNLFLRDGHIEAETSNDSPNAIYPPQQLASPPDKPTVYDVALPPSIQRIVEIQQRIIDNGSSPTAPEYLPTYGFLSNNRPGLHECAFWFLSCTYISSDEREWTDHSLSHFRGQEPPRSVQCPLCEFRGTWGDGWAAW